MREHQPFRVCFTRDSNRFVGVQVRPPGTFFPRPEGTLADIEVSVMRETDCIVADPGVGAITDHLAIDIYTKAVAGNRMNERLAFDREREGIRTFMKAVDFDRKGHLVERDRKWLGDKCVQEFFTSCLHADIQSLTEPEFDKGMESGYVIDVEMADEEENRFLLGYVPIGFRNTVSSVEDDVIVF
jgi:hypothetical protein